MRQRRKAVAEPPTESQSASWPTFGFVEIAHPPMVVLKPSAPHLTEVSLDVRGAYVKYAPVVRASEKAKFSAAASRAHYMLGGAAAVVVTPQVVPDAAEVESTKSETAAVLSPEAHLQAWFEGVKGPTGSFVTEAFEAAMTTLAEVGL